MSTMILKHSIILLMASICWSVWQRKQAERRLCGISRFLDWRSQMQWAEAAIAYQTRDLV